MKLKITNKSTATAFVIESKNSVKKIKALDDLSFSRYAFYQIILPSILDFSKEKAIDSPIFREKSNTHYFQMLTFLVKANNIYRIAPVESGWFFNKSQKKLIDLNNNPNAMQNDQKSVYGYCRQVENQKQLYIPTIIPDLIYSFFSCYRKNPIKDEINKDSVESLFQSSNN